MSSNDDWVPASSWLTRRTTALEAVVAVYEPAYRVPAALKRRLEAYASRVEACLVDGDELWSWRRPGREGSQPEGLAIVRDGVVVRSFRLAA